MMQFHEGQEVEVYAFNNEGGRQWERAKIFHFLSGCVRLNFAGSPLYVVSFPYEKYTGVVFEAKHIRAITPVENRAYELGYGYPGYD